HTAAERDVARNAARISALNEAKSRLIANRDEATTAHRAAESALGSLPAAAKIEGKLAAVRDEIEAKRATLAEARADAQAISREAELADRRLAAIAADQAAWSERRDGAHAQIATLAERSREAARERATFDQAPDAYAGKRRALIGQIEAAE